MENPLLLIPLFLWIFTYGVSWTFLHYLGKKLGNKRDALNLYRQPYFILNLLNSIVSIGLILLILNHPLSYQSANYLAVPYFGLIGYCMSTGFRVIKDHKSK